MGAHSLPARPLEEQKLRQPRVERAELRVLDRKDEVGHTRGIGGEHCVAEGR